jgi:hypothetical protein
MSNEELFLKSVQCLKYEGFEGAVPAMVGLGLLHIGRRCRVAVFTSLAGL